MAVTIKPISKMKKPKVTEEPEAEPLTKKQQRNDFKRRAQQQFNEQIRSSVGQPYNSSPKRYIKDDPFTPMIGNVGPYRKKEDPFDQGPNDGMERKNPIRNRQVKPSLRAPLVPPKKLGQKPPADDNSADDTDNEADDTPTETKEQRRQRLKQDLLNKNKNKNKNKNNPTDKPEDDTPTTPTTPPASTAPPPNVPAGRPASNSWPDIIGHYFPEGAGNYFKGGGLVRGGGAAQRGTGRGKMR